MDLTADLTVVEQDRVGGTGRHDPCLGEVEVTVDTPHHPPTPHPGPGPPAQVRALALTTDLTTAASIIGIGRTLAYDLARTDDFPVRILRLRGRVVVPTADLLTYLGHPTDDTTGERHRPPSR